MKRYVPVTTKFIPIEQNLQELKGKAHKSEEKEKNTSSLKQCCILSVNAAANYEGSIS